MSVNELALILAFQKEKLKEVAMKLTNPFWKDVLSSYHFAKPYTKIFGRDVSK
jgi:hypothetical protein